MSLCGLQSCSERCLLIQDLWLRTPINKNSMCYKKKRKSIRMSCSSWIYPISVIYVETSNTAHWMQIAKGHFNIVWLFSMHILWCTCLVLELELWANCVAEMFVCTMYHEEGLNYTHTKRIHKTSTLTKTTAMSSWIFINICSQLQMKCIQYAHIQ